MTERRHARLISASHSEAATEKKQPPREFARRLNVFRKR
jgi:hypothetical protein